MRGRKRPLIPRQQERIVTPTEILKHEHVVIQLVLGAAEREAQAMAREGRANRERVEKMLDFLVNFADRCHHAKEERLLFTRMQERGTPRNSGPLAVMLAEHEEGRSRLRAVRENLPQAASGDRAALAAVSDNLLAYVRLLRAHIEKEDDVLYPVADGMFSQEDQAALAEAFDKVEAEEMGEGVHEKYHKLAHELAEG
jgi:hemerythrin-like domain-containing protein